MSSFFTDLSNYSFLQFALIAALLSAIASGVVGTLIVVRRSTYVAGAIAHSVLGGMGAARYIQTVHGVEWLTPIAGAFIAAFIAALLISWATLYAKERIDSILSIIWALGMGIGITFIMKTPGYSQDPMSFLSGSILMIAKGDLLLLAILDVIVIAVVWLFYNRIVAICFNEEAARVKGIPVTLYTFLFLIMTAITTVLLSQIVGVVMVIALLSIPAATVSRFTRRLSSMMIGTTILSTILSVAGLGLSYAPKLPVGATIIELAGVCYLIALFIRPKTKSE